MLWTRGFSKKPRLNLRATPGGTFVDEGVSVALGGNGIVVPVVRHAASGSIPILNICGTLPKTFCPEFWRTLNALTLLKYF
jgi:hypothetical protein